MKPSRTARLAALSAVAVLVAVACGTTVPDDQLNALRSGGSINQELSAGSALPEGAHVNEKGQVISASGEVLGTAEEFGLGSGSGSVATGGSTAGSGSGAGSATSGGPGAGGGTSQNAGALGPGITDSKIFIAAAQIEAGPANEAATGQSISADAREGL